LHRRRARGRRCAAFELDDIGLDAALGEEPQLTCGEVCTTLGGATETPILILRITLQFCAAAPRAPASAIATTPAASAMRQIDR